MPFSLRLDDAPVIDSQEVSARDRPGSSTIEARSSVIEVLDVKKRFPNADPKTIRLEMA